jgi:hypothetical protein
VLRVNNDTRHYPANDVAAIEFVVGGPSAQAVNVLNRGQGAVVLRDGQIIEGRLTDIGGTSPLRLTIDTPSGTRNVESSQVAQVHLRKVESQSQSDVAATAGSSDVSITVPANQPWTEANVTVARGDRVRFVGSGDIMVAPGASGGVAGAEIKPAGRLPVPRAPVGALIARIGNGQPFLIGSSQEVRPMLAAGRIYLGINDEHFEDNTGEFRVTIHKEPR